MECPNCKKEMKFIEPSIFLNVEVYGNTQLGKTECCGKLFNVERKISFNISEYKGTKKFDNWEN